MGAQGKGGGARSTRDAARAIRCPHSTAAGADGAMLGTQTFGSQIPPPLLFTSAVLPAAWQRYLGTAPDMLSRGQRAPPPPPPPKRGGHRVARCAAVCSVSGKINDQMGDVIGKARVEIAKQGMACAAPVCVWGGGGGRGGAPSAPPAPPAACGVWGTPRAMAGEKFTWGRAGASEPP